MGTTITGEGEEVDSATASILRLIDQDMRQNPQRIHSLDEDFFLEIASLVEGVAVDTAESLGELYFWD